MCIVGICGCSTSARWTPRWGFAAEFVCSFVHWTHGSGHWKKFFTSSDPHHDMYATHTAFYVWNMQIHIAARLLQLFAFCTLSLVKQLPATSLVHLISACQGDETLVNHAVDLHLGVCKTLLTIFCKTARHQKSLETLATKNLHKATRTWQSHMHMAAAEQGRCIRSFVAQNIAGSVCIALPTNPSNWYTKQMQKVRWVWQHPGLHGLIGERSKQLEWRSSIPAITAHKWLIIPSK